MKIRLAVLLVVLAPVAASARDLAPGTWQLSGTTTLGLSRQSSSTSFADVTTSSFQASGALLYHVARNLGVGLGTSFGLAKTEVTVTDPSPLVGAADSSSISWSIGPIAEWRAPLGDRVSFLASAGVMYIRSHYSGEAPFTSSTLDGVSAAGGVGLSWFVVDRVSLDGTLAYEWARYGASDVRTTSSSLSALAGVSVYLGGD